MNCGTVECELVAVPRACHSAFFVQLHKAVKDFVENVSVEDGNREEIANEVQGIYPGPKARDTDLAGPPCGIERSKGFLACVVNGIATPIMLRVPQELLAVFPHHVAPQIKVWRIGRRQDRCRLKDARWHDAQHSSRDRHLTGAASKQKECGARPAMTER